MNVLDELKVHFWYSLRIVGLICSGTSRNSNFVMKLGLFSYISTCIYFFTRSLTIDTSMYNLTGVLILVVTDEK